MVRHRLAGHAEGHEARPLEDRWRTQADGGVHVGEAG
jgi:hypothetical protein